MMYPSFRRPIEYPILDLLISQDNGRRHRMKCSPEEQSPWKIPFLMSILPVDIISFGVEMCNDVYHFFMREE